MSSLLVAGLALSCGGEPPLPNPDVMEATCGDVAWSDPLRDSLGPDWSWVHEVPGDWSTSPEGLSIRTTAGTIWGWSDSGRNFLVRDLPTGIAWCAEIAIDFDPQVWPEQAGFLVYTDDDRWAKLVVEKVDATHIAGVTAYERWGFTTLSGGTAFPGRPWWLRLVRSGDQLLGFARSEQDAGWHAIGISPLPGGTPRLGLFSQGGPEGNSRAALFRDLVIRRAARP